MPAAELDERVQRDPEAKQLATELAWKKLDERYYERVTKPGGKNPYTKRHSEEVDRLQNHYDERVKQLEAKVRQSKRSLIQTEIVKLQAMLATLRQQQSEPQAATPAAESDANAIQGTWKIVRGNFGMLVSTVSGEEDVTPAQVRDTTRIVIAPDTLAIVGPHVFNRVCGYQLNPDVKPGAIDIRAEDSVYLGIFQQTGNELKICATCRGSEAYSRPEATRRPTEFWAELRSNTQLLVLRRVSDSVVTEEDKSLRGTWQVESPSISWFPEFARGQQLVISPRTMKFAQPPADATGVPLYEHIYYALGPASQPRIIDISYNERHLGAIYKLRGDRLSLCFREFGNGQQGRPARFAADDKTHTALVVLKRVAEPAGKSPAQGTSAEKPGEAPLQFGPVIERVVNALGEGKGKDAIDLADGKLVDLPKDFDTWPAEKKDKWSAQNNVDLFVTAHPVPAGRNTDRPVGTPSWQLAPEGLKLAAVWGVPEKEGHPIAWNKWENITVSELRSALTSKVPGKATTLGGVSLQVAELYEQRGTTYFDIVAGLPVTFAFQTRKGELGLLRVVGYAKEPLGLRIRYKLVQPPPAAGDVDAAAELSALKGKWKVVRVEHGTNAAESWAGICECGSPLNPSLIYGFEFGERVNQDLSQILLLTAKIDPRDISPGNDGPQKIEFSCTLDLTAMPKALDLHRHYEMGGTTGKLTGVGVYEIKGDRLTICLARALPWVKSSSRPKEVAVRPGSEDVLFVLERYRPAGDEQAVQGNWVVAEETDDGKLLSSQTLQGRRYLFSDQFVTLFLKAGGVAEQSWLWSIDAAKQPKTITMSGFESDGEGGYKRDPKGSPKKEELRGIYRFEGKRLTIAFRKGDKLPEKFASQPGSGVTLLVLERPATPKPATRSRSPAVSAATPKQSSLAFGPLTERTINAIGEGKGGEGIDFREDKRVDMPKEASQWTLSEKSRWMELHNVDLALDYTAQFWVGNDKRRILAFINSGNHGWRWRHIAASRLATATSEEVREELGRDQPVGAILLDGEDRNKPSTFSFITGKGDVGVMQVVAYHEDPRSVTIRYRVAKRPRSLHFEDDLHSRYRTSIARLPQGSVELIGVTFESPFQPGQVWWAADGKPIFNMVPLRSSRFFEPFKENVQARTF